VSESVLTLIMVLFAWSDHNSFLVFSPFCRKVLSAPNLLRVGTAENIFVECQDCPDDSNFTVNINVMSYPTKSKRLAFTSVKLSPENKFQGFGKIEIPAGDFRRDPKAKQYVYLQAQFPDVNLEKLVLLSFHSGYIFIQMDKNLYTPNSKVYYRIFALTPDMKPVERNNETSMDASVAIEFVTPEGIILPRDPVSLRSGIHSGDFQLAEIVSVGLWKVIARFHSKPHVSFSAEFEVKDYVLPSFEVKLVPQDSFFYVDNKELCVDIEANYMFGEVVTGSAYGVFGVVHQDQKRNFPSSLQRVLIQDGKGNVTMKSEHITQTFKNITDLVGSTIFVVVSVLTEDGSEMVEAELGGIYIVTTSYSVDFTKTPKYYKPGMSFDVAVEVLNPDGSPAANVPVVIDAGQVEGITSANGVAKLSINTDENPRPLTLTVKTNIPHIPPARQASATMTALPYTSKSNSYIHIGVTTADVKLGDNLKVSLNFNKQDKEQNDLTYLIQSAGQLVKHGRFRAKGQVMISVLVTVTKEMLPSFRIVAYYHTNDDEVVSDSVWVDVHDSCMGSLTLESMSSAPSYEPRKMYSLKITGDPGATVGLVAVDKSVFVLSSKRRLTQKKVWEMVEKYDTGCTPGGGKDSMSVFYDAGLLFKSSTRFGTPYRQDPKCSSPSRRKRASDMMNVTTSESDDNSYMDSSDVLSRTKFPESWLWTDVKLPACSKSPPNCETTSIVKQLPLQDSITTWQFTGISLSQTNGLCVAKPLDVTVAKPFFIDLKLPNLSVRGEQIEIKAVLHNYHPNPATVRVDLTEEVHVCSAASKRGKYRQEVQVGANSRRSIPFVIIPTKQGQFRIEVKAVIIDSSHSDGVMKMLLVVSVLAGIKPKDVLQNTITGESMGVLFYQPSGCGEENMIHMSLPLIATTYLDTTNQWEDVGIDKRDEALQYIRTGYQNQLAYRKRDGSFAGYPDQQSSSWLTAYAVKVFTMVNSLVAVRSSAICDAVKFLILNAQTSDGLFRETGWIAHPEMIGDVNGTDSDVSMTAFCLIAIQESSRICASTGFSGSIDKAVAYLQKRLPSLINPYAAAMASYALANENKLNLEILHSWASPDLSHWPVPKGRVHTLEATAYALLALVKSKAFKEARLVVRWLNKQQRENGGYGSTQATMIVYQSVAEYWSSDRDPDYDLNVDILLPGRSKPDKYNLNWENHFATRTSKVNNINQNVKVIATGPGEASLTMVSLYYALPKEKDTDCQKFNMSVQLLPEKTDEDKKIYKLRITVLYKDKYRDATMTVLDVGMLTGFTAVTKDLNLLSKGRARTIARYQENNDASERNSLLIYLDKVSHTKPDEITFSIQRELKVGVLQPAAVSVYEYNTYHHQYQFKNRCVKFYHPEREAGKLLRLCKNDICTCAEENCSKQKKGKINNSDRTEKVCETLQNSKIEFAYKVRVEEFTEDLSTDVYRMLILHVVKEGSSDVGPQNKQRLFLSYPHCREVLDLEKGKTYLIMGTSKDIYADGQSRSYQYSLGENSWVEYWPTATECKTAKYKPTCGGLDEMVQQYTLHGCPH
uniref:Complement C3-like n=1 Tax=Kryptolebias marmoratus TaxID=37003 RepID=A0A3Q3B616_KRYMA